MPKNTNRFLRGKEIWILEDYDDYLTEMAKRLRELGGTVKPFTDVKDLIPEYFKLKKLPEIFIVDILSPSKGRMFLGDFRKWSRTKINILRFLFGWLYESYISLSSERLRKMILHGVIKVDSLKVWQLSMWPWGGIQFLCYLADPKQTLSINRLEKPILIVNSILHSAAKLIYDLPGVSQEIDSLIKNLDTLLSKKFGEAEWASEGFSYIVFVSKEGIKREKEDGITSYDMNQLALERDVHLIEQALKKCITGQE